MPSTKDLNLLESPIKALFISRPGKGKTVGACSWYKAGEIFVADWDKRMKPAALMYPGADIKYKSYESNQFSEFRSDFLALIAGGPVDLLDGDGILHFEDTPKTIVFDSLTFFSYGLMDYLLSFRGPNSKTVNKEGDPRSFGSIQVADFGEYKGEFMGLAQTLEIAKKIPCNFIMTAHELESLDIKGGGKMSVGKKNVITVGSKAAQLMPAFFDEIWKFDVEESVSSTDAVPREYMVYTDPTMDCKTVLPLPRKFKVTHPENLYDRVRYYCNNPEAYKEEM